MSLKMHRGHSDSVTRGHTKRAETPVPDGLSHCRVRGLVHTASREGCCQDKSRRRLPAAASRASYRGDCVLGWKPRNSRGIQTPYG